MNQCKNMNIDSTMPQCGNMHIDSTMPQCGNMHGDSTMPQCGTMQCYSDGGNTFSNCDNEFNPSNIVNNDNPLNIVNNNNPLNIVNNNNPLNIVNNNNPLNIVNNDNQYQFLTSNMTPNLTKSMISSPPTPLSNPFGLSSRSYISSSSNTLSNGIGSSSITPHIFRQYTQPVNPEYGAILMASNMNPNAPKSHRMISTQNKPHDERQYAPTSIPMTPQMILNTPKSYNPNNNTSISSTIVPDNSAEIKTTNTNTNRHTNNQEEDTTNINENTNNHTQKRIKAKHKRIFCAIPKDPLKSMKDIRNRSLEYVNCESKQFYVLPEKFGGGMTKIVRYMQSNGCWSEHWYCEYKHCVPHKDFPNEHGRLVKDALRHMISAKHLKKWQLPFHCNSCDGRWAWDHHMTRHSCANMKLKKYECVYCGTRYMETHECKWAGFRLYDRIDNDTLIS